MLGRESTVNLPLEIQGGALAPPRTTTTIFVRKPAFRTKDIRLIIVMNLFGAIKVYAMSKATKKTEHVNKLLINKTC